MSTRARRAALLLLGLWGLGTASAYGAGAHSAEPRRALATADAPGPRALHLLCDGALTVWRKARDRGTRESCALVVRARAGLWSRPAQALREAARAVELAPSSLEAVTALAAATHASGNVQAAGRLFAEAALGAHEGDWARLPSSLQLLAARAASLSGQRSEALAQYRLIILDLERVEGPHERARVLLEAAVLAARTEPPSMPEALAYFRQTADHPSPRLASVRFLVGRALGVEGGESPEAEVEQTREGLRWMLKAHPRAMLTCSEPRETSKGGGPLAREWPPVARTALTLTDRAGEGGLTASDLRCGARGAPGELLPVLAPDLLAEILPPAPDEAASEELPADEAP